MHMFLKYFLVYGGIHNKQLNDIADSLTTIWGEPERAPHKREVRAVGRSVCLSVCRSVRTFMTRKYTRVILIYGVPSVVDCSV